jgi:NAD(P)-dependent dehydrogenase (short-subunit alcohol dehydrogenase family)
VTDRFTGKTALVTGAGRGIGRAVALGLAEAGADLILLARSSDQLEATRAVLADRGMARGRVLVIATDLGDEGGRGQAVRAALARGRVDILINNAGTVEPLGTTAEIPSAELRWAFEVNVIAPAALTAAVLPGMAQAGWGRIVNVSSGIAARPEAMVRGNAYAATKAALEAHTVNLAAELRGTGVTANVFRPGRVDTAMQEWIRGQDPQRIGAALHGRFTRMHAERALITPEQSAHALLARLEGSETGAVWDVDDPAAAPIPKPA